jgi:hypothetical protein
MTGDAPAAAVAALSAALGADPGKGDLWGELATALVAAGRAREAWDAAVRAVELAPQSAASHRAIGAVAAALGDVRQAESAYQHALRLDPADRGTRTALSRLRTLTPPPAPTGRRRAPDPGPAAPTGRRRASEPGAPSAAGRRRAPDPDEETARAATGSWRVEVQPGGGGKRRAPEPATGGRRRAPEPDPVAEPAGGGGRWAPNSAVAEPAGGGRRPGERIGRGAVGLPGWLAPPPGAVGAAAVPVGATRVADPDAWRKALVAVIRIEWLVGVACFVGLAYGRTAPYTAGLLAGAIVVAGAYARLRWQGAHTRRPPARDRVPTYAAVAAVAVAVVVVPAAMVGALTLARVAAVAAVTCATFAAMLIGRDAG